MARSLIALPGATLFSSAIVPPVSAPLPRLSLMPSRSAFLLPPGFSLSTNAVGITETQTGVGSDAIDFTTYTAGSAVYQIHSDSPQNELPEPMEGTPEPATMGLLGL